MKRILISFLAGILTPLIVLIVLGFMGLLPVRATSKPPGIEEEIAGRALDARLERDAKGLRNPMKADEPTLLAGMKSYRDGCAGCHGTPGKPSPWGTKNFYPRVPQFAEEGADMPEAEMFLVVKYGVRYTGMAGWEGLVSDDEMWRVVTFLGHLQSLPPSVAAEWNEKPAPAGL